MKKLLLFCFLISSSLMAMNNVAEKGSALDQNWKPMIIVKDMFDIKEGIFTLKETSIQEIMSSCYLKDTISYQQVEHYVTKLPEKASEFAFSAGKAEVNEYYQSFYDTNPKKIVLGIAAFIVASSVIYTGKKVVDKFRKWRNNDNE